MSSSCKDGTMNPDVFPREISNRPGLPHISYRIGDYTSFRREMLGALDRAPELLDWTHRGSDDPGIALLEGAATLADILTFYQEQYANEAYLRTARWSESIADLAALTGYRLAPGVGGRGVFALTVKGESMVQVPSGFPFSAQLDRQEKSSVFEALADTEVFPRLSRFNIFQPRLDTVPVSAGMARFEIQSVRMENTDIPEECDDAPVLEGLEIKTGDRLLIVRDQTMYNEDTIEHFYNMSSEVLIVKDVHQIMDRFVVECEGGIQLQPEATVTVYKIGRSFRHFGHNAPPVITKLDNSEPPHLTEEGTAYKRKIVGNHVSDSANRRYYSNFLEREYAFDGVFENLSAGTKFICEGTDPDGLNFAVVRKVISRRNDTLQWGHATGSSTLVSFDRRLLNNRLLVDEDLIAAFEYNIRHLHFHEIKSPRITLRGPTCWSSDELSGDSRFNYWGRPIDVIRLKQRKVVLHKEGAEALETFVSSIPDNEANRRLNTAPEVPRMWPITLGNDRGDLAGRFDPEDFSEQNPKVTVYGNLVEADQGKTVKEASLGSGDSREIFQTFKIPEAPLTFLRSPGDDQGCSPELEVFVEGCRWTRVTTLFGHGPEEEIYIVRQDSKDRSWVQFGDGKTGRRLPSGRKNVTARFRVGTGAYGPAKDPGGIKAGARLDGIGPVFLPGGATGGADPESGANAKEVVPGTVQSLGRLVSISDFESEALRIAGVRKAAARWSITNGIASVAVTVLMKWGRARELEQVRIALNQANRERGSGRHPVLVNGAIRQYVNLHLGVGYDPNYHKSDVERNIRETLGVADGVDESDFQPHGLFGIDDRGFGQPEYATRIEGIVQGCHGVRWARVLFLCVMHGSGDNLDQLDYPQITRRKEVVSFSAEFIEQAERVMLTLHPRFFNLEMSAIDQTEVVPDE